MILEHSLLLSWIGAAAVLLILWRAFREKPRYVKKYFCTRADGAFATDYVDGFEKYLVEVEDDVAFRITVGPISPADDLLAELYHPEIKENWMREFDPSHSIKKIVEIMFSIGAIVLIANGVVTLLTGHFGLLYYWGTSHKMFERLVGFALAGSLYVWLYRRRWSISQTQGYLDGYSDGISKRILPVPCRSNPNA